MDLQTVTNLTAEQLFRTKCIGDYGKQSLEDFLSLFYLLHPEGSTFDNWEDVPFYEFGVSSILI